MQLINKTKNQVIATSVEEARGFTQRSKGLLGRASIAGGYALWIHRCNSIHTFFMKFSLDVIFVDRNLKVKAIRTNLQPWRMVLPILTASSVFEMKAGQLNTHLVEKGDILSVSN